MRHFDTITIFDKARKHVATVDVAVVRVEAPVSKPDARVFFPTVDDLKKHYPVKDGFVLVRE